MANGSSSILKLVVGKQVYGTWTGPLYPNCSSAGQPPDATAGKPWFRDVKFFGESVNFSSTEAGENKLLWVHDCGDGCLFDVVADPNEHVDLAAERPSVMQDLRTQLTRLNKGLFNPGRGETNVTACDVGVEEGGFYGPFVGIDGFYVGRAPYKPGPAQRAKDAAFKALVRRLNTPSMTAKVVGAVRHALPLVRTKLYGHIDQCLAPPAAAQDEEAGEEEEEKRETDDDVDGGMVERWFEENILLSSL